VGKGMQKGTVEKKTQEWVFLKRMQGGDCVKGMLGGTVGKKSQLINSFSPDP